MTELQKAVSEAERKAHDMITTERAKMERTVAEAKRQAAEDALAVINQQEDSSECDKEEETCTQTVLCIKEGKGMILIVMVIVLTMWPYTFFAMKVDIRK
ncbi:UNVERIFIED_CONTAM: Protein CBFA2T1 [Gekko kuhli]